MEDFQRRQIERQISAYESQKESRTVQVPFGNASLELEIDPFVANPEIMNSGVQMVSYLVEHPKLVRDKTVIDMGTGSGIIGISAGILGAEKVWMSDVDAAAIHNTERNIMKHSLSGHCEALVSDLFDNFPKDIRADVHIFNHPFFTGSPESDKPWTQMMLAETDLLDRYFTTAPQLSHPDAIYLMPWLTLAGNELGIDNDPGKRAADYGLRVQSITTQQPVNLGIQQAEFRIYELTRD